MWCCTALKGSNSVAVGYDEGTILIKMGRDEPAVTMDVNGKLIWARHSELCQGRILSVKIIKYQQDNKTVTFSNSPWYGL